MIINNTQYSVMRYRTKTTLNERWNKSLDNKWYGKRYNILGDKYETDFDVYGTRDGLDGLLLYLKELRDTDVDFVMVQFEGDEHVFGANVDLTLPVKCVFERNFIKQNTSQGSSINISARLLEPVFYNYDTFPNIINFVTAKYISDMEKSEIKMFSDFGEVSTSDKISDMGIFDGTIQLTTTELVGLRNWMRLYGTESVNIFDMVGIDYLFGQESQIDYPISVTKIEINNEKQLNHELWEINIKMHQEEY